jgi:outer membrane protein assembly complex protein YaeT
MSLWRKILTLLLVLAATLQAQDTPTAPPEPTPLPGLSPQPVQPAPSPAVTPVPPRPTQPEIPEQLPAPQSTPTVAPASPLEMETVQPYQPALPLEAPVRKPPVLKHLRVLLDGNHHFTADALHIALADSLTSIEQSGLSPALADDAAFFLGVHYRRNGYSQADVQWAIEPGSTLRLTIHEGPFTQIGAITFAGNWNLSQETLSGYVTGGTRERFPNPKQPLPFVESDITGGVERIRGLYRSEGYLDATVEPPHITLTADKTSADIQNKNPESDQYRFGKITFQGDIIFYPEQALRKEMEVFTRKPYTPVALTNLERKIVYFYRSRGYFTAKVTNQSNPAQAVNGWVAVKFIVEAGAIYRFDGVTQTGLKKLHPSFLRHRFASLKGQVYDPEKVEERYRQLIGTGLFSNLRITQEALPNHEVGLHFDAQEAKSRELGFSIGYTKVDGPLFGTRYVDRDLFGYGRPLTIDTEVAQKLLRGEVLYSDPWIFESDTTLNLRLYALNQDLDGYSKTESGLRPELTHKFGKHLQLGTFILTRDVHLTDNGIDVNEVGPTHYRTDSLGLTATYDTRDSVLNPRRGFVINATGDCASNILGSSLEFLRGTFRASYYLPVGTDSLLATGVRGGFIAPMDSKSDQLPIDERFFNGGATSVRSFSDRTLGPRDSNGYAVGGETFTVANVELNTPLRDNLDGALFFDAGSTGRRLGSGLGQTGFAIGPGLRYRLPIGPIRFDYGWNPVREAHQPTGAFHFSFGFAF